MKALPILALLLAPTAFADISVSKAKYIEAIREGLPKMFCGESAYFRKCFQISAETCTKTAAAALEACLKEFEPKVPTALHSPDEGGEWGEKIGGCAGKTFEVNLTKKKVDSADCRNVEKWKALPPPASK